MMKTTKDTVRAICTTDPSISLEQMKTALAALNGEVVVSKPPDRGLSRRQVAAMLGVSLKTVSTYTQRGLIKGLSLGDRRGYIHRYSEESVRALLADNKEF